MGAKGTRVPEETKQLDYFLVAGYIESYKTWSDSKCFNTTSLCLLLTTREVGGSLVIESKKACKHLGLQDSSTRGFVISLPKTVWQGNCWLGLYSKGCGLYSPGPSWFAEENRKFDWSLDWATYRDIPLDPIFMLMTFLRSCNYSLECFIVTGND